MSSTSQKVLSEALTLSPTDRAELVEQLLSSFEQPTNTSIDQLWIAESEERIEAYNRGELSSKSINDIF